MKVVKFALAAVAVAAIFIPGVGAAISGAVYGVLGGGAGSLAAAATAAGIADGIAAAVLLAGAQSALGIVAKAVGLGPKPPKQSPASLDRLRTGLDPRASRKIVFGYTATALDVGYQEYTGSSQEYLNSIVVNASHALQSIDEIWFDEKTAWSQAGGVLAGFTGYFSVTKREVGTAANAFTITGSTEPWTSTDSPSRRSGMTAP